MGGYRKAAWLAGGTALAAYCLITLGGMVHNTGSSLACPDWPLCHGEWLPAMKGGVLYEHSHRLLGAAVGLGIIALNVLLWSAAPGPPARRAARWGLLGGMVLLSLVGGAMIGPMRTGPAVTTTLAVCLAGLTVLGFMLLGTRRAANAPPDLSVKALALLDLVLLQGLLGGATVKYQLPHLVSTAHLALSMIVLLTLVYLARACAWRAADDGDRGAAQHTPPLAEQAANRLAGRSYGDRTGQPPALGALHLYQVMLAAVYLQMVLGALIRHTGASTVAGWGLRYAILGQDPTTGTYALWPAYLPAAVNVLHRYLAVLVAFMVIVGCARARALLGGWLAGRGGAWRAWLPAGLVALQVLVGVVMLAAWELEGYPGLHAGPALSAAVQIGLRTAHLAVATALLVSLFDLTLWAGAAGRAAAIVPAPEGPDRGSRQSPTDAAFVD